MQLTITIGLDNDAFAGDWRQEAGRILGTLGGGLMQHSGYGLDDPGESRPLFDVNGNKVGLAKLTGRKVGGA